MIPYASPIFTRPVSFVVKLSQISSYRMAGFEPLNSVAGFRVKGVPNFIAATKSNLVIRPVLRRRSDLRSQRDLMMGVRNA